MNPFLLRYVGLALVAAVFGLGGGYLAKNASPAPQSGTVVAVPAQPFPGQGIPAIPAIPAQPQKGKPDIGNPTISYVHGTMSGKNQVVDSALLLGPTYIPHEIVGTNFSNRRNTIYWDDTVLVRDESCRDISGCSVGGVEDKIILPVPMGLQLGSFHTVYVKNNYGTSNKVQVQAVEHLDIPVLWGIKPDRGSVGMKGEALIWDSFESAYNPYAKDTPRSAKIYLDLTVPASMVKSGATGMTNVFIPTPLERNASDPSRYSFTLPDKVVYCPSWGWDAKDCTLAGQDTMVSLTSTGGNPGYSATIFFIYDFQYRGIESGIGNGGTFYPGFYGSNGPWFSGITITP